jgi:hypothetical protein
MFTRRLLFGATAIVAAVVGAYWFLNIEEL